MVRKNVKKVFRLSCCLRRVLVVNWWVVGRKFYLEWWGCYFGSVEYNYLGLNLVIRGFFRDFFWYKCRNSF